eukprot:PLAT3299.4.p1 GENE.PLAT3299.4~~PLAT3299.4.p1  ORF type:complete len:1290 (-),score=534.50 PLAT3299.4:50-3919(-)
MRGSRRSPSRGKPVTATSARTLSWLPADGVSVEEAVVRSRLGGMTTAEQRATRRLPPERPHTSSSLRPSSRGSGRPSSRGTSGGRRRRARRRPASRSSRPGSRSASSSHRAGTSHAGGDSVGAGGIRTSSRHSRSAGAAKSSPLDFGDELPPPTSMQRLFAESVSLWAGSTDGAGKPPRLNHVMTGADGRTPSGALPDREDAATTLLARMHMSASAPLLPSAGGSSMMMESTPLAGAASTAILGLRSLSPAGAASSSMLSLTHGGLGSSVGSVMHGGGVGGGGGGGVGRRPLAPHVLGSIAGTTLHASRAGQTYLETLQSQAVMMAARVQMLEEEVAEQRRAAAEAVEEAERAAKEAVLEKLSRDVVDAGAEEDKGEAAGGSKRRVSLSSPEGTLREISSILSRLDTVFVDVENEEAIQRRAATTIVAGARRFLQRKRYLAFREGLRRWRGRTGFLIHDALRHHRVRFAAVHDKIKAADAARRVRTLRNVLLALAGYTRLVVPMRRRRAAMAEVMFERRQQSTLRVVVRSWLSLATSKRSRKAVTEAYAKRVAAARARLVARGITGLITRGMLEEELAREATSLIRSRSLMYAKQRHLKAWEATVLGPRRRRMAMAARHADMRLLRLTWSALLLFFQRRQKEAFPTTWQSKKRMQRRYNMRIVTQHYRRTHLRKHLLALAEHTHRVRALARMQSARWARQCRRVLAAWHERAAAQRQLRRATVARWKAVQESLLRTPFEAWFVWAADRRAARAAREAVVRAFRRRKQRQRVYMTFKSWKHAFLYGSADAIRSREELVATLEQQRLLGHDLQDNVNEYRALMEKMQAQLDEKDVRLKERALELVAADDRVRRLHFQKHHAEQEVVRLQTLVDQLTLLHPGSVRRLAERTDRAFQARALEPIARSLAPALKPVPPLDADVLRRLAEPRPASARRSGKSEAAAGVAVVSPEDAELATRARWLLERLSRLPKLSKPKAEARRLHSLFDWLRTGDAAPLLVGDGHDAEDDVEDEDVDDDDYDDSEHDSEDVESEDVDVRGEASDSIAALASPAASAAAADLRQRGAAGRRRSPSSFSASEASLGEATRTSMATRRARARAVLNTARAAASFNAAGRRRRESMAAEAAAATAATAAATGEARRKAPRSSASASTVMLRTTAASRSGGPLKPGTLLAERAAAAREGRHAVKKVTGRSRGGDGKGKGASPSPAATAAAAKKGKRRRERRRKRRLLHAHDQMNWNDFLQGLTSKFCRMDKSVEASIARRVYEADSRVKDASKHKRQPFNVYAKDALAE